jgi:hypothetical protein
LFVLPRSQASAQANLVPNPGFETGQGPVPSCFTNGACHLDDFDDHIDAWRVALYDPDTPCFVRTDQCPDWIDVTFNTVVNSACAAAAGNTPPNTSNRFVLLARGVDTNIGARQIEKVRVGLTSFLRSGTQYIVSLRMCVANSNVGNGATLRLHLTHFGDHWNSGGSDNPKILDVVNFTIPPNAPHDWYTFQQVFSIPGDKDNALGNLILEPHYNDPSGTIIYVDDVSIQQCTAAIAQQPSSVNAFSGDDVSFSVTYSGPQTPTYSWRKASGPPVDFNDGHFSGMDTNTLHITGATPNDAGSYVVDISCPCGQLTSSPGYLGVCPERVAINQQPNTPVTAYAGSSVSMVVSATGPAPLSYGWNNVTHQVGLADGPRIHGTGTPVLTIDPVLPSDAGTYNVVVGSDCEGVASQNVVLTVEQCSGGGPVVFGPNTPFTAGSGPSAIARGDLNGDGKPDLVTANQFGSSVSVLLGNGDGTYSPKQDFPIGVGPYSVAVGDLNGDGKPDLAAALFGVSAVSVLLGDGAGGFGPDVEFPAGAQSRMVAIADVNGDNKPDLVTANQTGNSVSVLLGNGDGTFAPKTDFATGSGTVSVTVADLNDDGQLDLIAANYYDGTISVLLGNGDGTFSPKTDNTAGTGATAVASADLNSDGKLDVAVVNQGSSTISVMLGNGSGSFGPKGDFPTGSSPYSMAIRDMNADGKLDLATADVASNTVSVLLGDGTGGFGTPTPFATGNTPVGLTTMDLNGDGPADLAVVNQGDSTVTVLLSGFVCNTVRADPPKQPYRLALSAVPNPVSGPSHISFTLPARGIASIEIYDLAGRRLRGWDLSGMSAGQHQLDWDGLDSGGRPVPSGVLFWHLQAGGLSLSRKVIRMH